MTEKWPNLSEMWNTLSFLQLDLCFGIYIKTKAGFGSVFLAILILENKNMDLTARQTCLFYHLYLKPWKIIYSHLN